MKALFFPLLVLGCTSDSSPCADDADGINGGDYTFALAVSDVAFTPLILKSQNDANVTLTISNTGTTPHDFSVDCLPTPNSLGCPAESCFDQAATSAPIAPGSSVTLTFTTPNPEGIYTFRSGIAGDTMTGQLVIQ